MDFELSEAHKQIRTTVRNFAEKEITPYIEKWERDEYFPKDLIKRMGELGFFGVAFPEEYGGTGMGWLANTIVAEELGRASLGVASCLNMQSGTCPVTILNWGTEEQKRKYLPRIISGEALGCFAVTEPNAATDMAAIETTAIAQGDHYVVNGSKTWITHATVFNIGILFAKTNPKERHKGLSAFIITDDIPGMERQKITDKLGTRSSDTGQLFFTDARIPKENLLGEEGQGFTIAESSLVYGRTSIAGRSLGHAQACLDAAVSYANQREQFGVKIGTFQMVKELIAEMATEVEAARLLVYKNAWLIDQGQPSRRIADMAKLYTSEVAVRAALNTMKIYGAYGYSSEYPAARLYRDAMLMTIGEGTNNIQKILLANDALGWKKLD